MNLLELSNDKECLDFAQWFSEASFGDNYIYTVDVSFFEPKSSVKKLAWEYAIDGKIYITQKRLGDGLYMYLALKAKHKLTKLVPWDYWYENPRKIYMKRQKKEAEN